MKTGAIMADGACHFAPPQPAFSRRCKCAAMMSTQVVDNFVGKPLHKATKAPPAKAFASLLKFRALNSSCKSITCTIMTVV
jgi:hypothetical protein